MDHFYLSMPDTEESILFCSPNHSSDTRKVLVIQGNFHSFHCQAVQSTKKEKYLSEHFREPTSKLLLWLYHFRPPKLIQIFFSYSLLLCNSEMTCNCSETESNVANFFLYCLQFIYLFIYFIFIISKRQCHDMIINNLRVIF